MPQDIAYLMCALLVNLATMAIALPSVMGKVSVPARHAQVGLGLQAIGWALLLLSTLTVAGSWADRLVSSLSMACLATSLACLVMAFQRWCGRVPDLRLQASVAVVLTLGYALGFSSYAFRVGWANGLLALQMGMATVTLMRTPLIPVGRWRWMLVVSILAQMLVTAWRGVLGAFFTDSYPSFLAPHPVNYAFAIVGNATAVLSLIGILLAHRDEAARALERLATLDGLTGVFNRRAWMALAQRDLVTSIRHGHSLAVFMIDLDNFKRINDTLGHEAGDRALKFVARALMSSSRAGDLVGRYGGEEFCVLMNRADHAAAHAFDDRLRERLGNRASKELGFSLSYSAGIAMPLAPDDTLEAMIRRADSTLYRAKAEGRDRTLDDESALMNLV